MYTPVLTAGTGDPSFTAGLPGPTVPGHLKTAVTYRYDVLGNRVDTQVTV